MSQRQDPFYDVVLAKQNIDPVSLPEGSQVYPINESSFDAIRAIVRVEVRKALAEIITEIRMQQHEGLTILR